jgi:NPCBM/NEW2 domain
VHAHISFVLVILKHRRVVTAVLVIAVASACGGNEHRAGTSATTSTTAATHSTNVPLYQQFERASSAGANGQAIDATLAGKRYPSSTGMWVGCEGAPATATYRLDHNFSRLTAAVGLQAHTPDGLTARVTITGDNRLLTEIVASKTATVPVDVTLVGTDSLVVSAMVDQGTCAGSDTPYGALGDALLIQVGV